MGSLPKTYQKKTCPGASDELKRFRQGACHVSQAATPKAIIGSQLCLSVSPSRQCHSCWTTPALDAPGRQASAHEKAFCNDHFSEYCTRFFKCLLFRLAFCAKCTVVALYILSTVTFAKNFIFPVSLTRGLDYMS